MQSESAMQLYLVVETNLEESSECPLSGVSLSYLNGHLLGRNVSYYALVNELQMKKVSCEYRNNTRVEVWKAELQHEVQQ